MIPISGANTLLPTSSPATRHHTAPSHTSPTRLYSSRQYWTTVFHAVMPHNTKQWPSWRPPLQQTVPLPYQISCPAHALTLDILPLGAQVLLEHKMAYLVIKPEIIPLYLGTSALTKISYYDHTHKPDILHSSSFNIS